MAKQSELRAEGREFASQSPEVLVQNFLVFKNECKQTKQDKGETFEVFNF